MIRYILIITILGVNVMASTSELRELSKKLISFNKMSTPFILDHNGVERKIGIYKHYKGRYYNLIGKCTHTETGEDLILYQSMYDDFKRWVRPLKMFFETVQVDGKERERFTFVCPFGDTF